MTPRDALNRLADPLFQAERPAPQQDPTPRSEAEARLASLMEEIVTTPIEDFVRRTRTLPRRDPSEALRWFVLSDVLALVVGVFAAWATLVAANHFLPTRVAPFVFESWRLVEFGLIGAGALLWLGAKGHYERRQPFWMGMQQIVMAFGFAAIASGFFHFATKQDFSRLWVVSGWFFAALALVGLRTLVCGLLRRRGLWQVRTLLVGSGALAEDARAALRSEKALGYEIAMQVENLPMLLAQVDHSWEDLCDRFNADYVVIALDGPALAQADDALARLARSGIPFSVSPPLRHLPVLGMSPQYFFCHDVMLFSPVNNLEQFLPRVIKRSMDIVLSGAAIAVLSPLFLFLAWLVRRDGGPALYGQERVGIKGRMFHCLKFRSMVMDGDEALRRFLANDEAAQREWKVMQKLRKDPRVTKVGAVMRKWSLDELPQLFNVLKGDMSLVGPRPAFREQIERYQDEIDLYYRVRPGLTGLWQVSGRNNVTFEQRVQMDSWYVKNWSLWHDIAIICKTVPVVLNKTGAY